VARREALVLIALVALDACDVPADPPMPRARASAFDHATPQLPGGGGDADIEAAAPELRPLALSGSASFPFAKGAAKGAPEGPTEPREEPLVLGPEELVSIATETSIYAEPRWGSRRLGYLRAGAAVRRSRAPLATGPKCAEGWYGVEPRGYVCAGSLASLDRSHPVALASARRPLQGGLPYVYALSRSPPPALYGKLPTRAEQRRFEDDLDKHPIEVPVARPDPAGDGGANGTPGATTSTDEDTVPAWLLPGRPSLSLGNLWHAPDRVLLGRARARSGFALLGIFGGEGRRFGVTTGLEVLPIDRVRLVYPSTISFAGIALSGEVTLPVAFVKKHGAMLRPLGPQGLGAGRALAYREAVPLTGEARTVGGAEYLVTREGGLLLASQCVIARAPRTLPAWAREGAKWIDVSIPRQVLVAYEGERPVYATLVSTGTGGTGDPATTSATVQGAFRIYEKHITVTMDGDAQSDSFDLRDVPFVQYFSEGYALHGVYWHDDFGHLHSHGCVNLAPRDAAWLFGWTDPRLPPGWHGVTSKGGTIVYVHD
jgi:L,D-transpeptidase catalytic domain